MTTTGLSAEFENIRLLRRRVRIHAQLLAAASTDEARASARQDVDALVEALLSAMDAFADAGHEETLARLAAQSEG